MRTRPLNASLVTAGLAGLTLLSACSSTPPALTLTEAYVAERSDAATLVNVVVKATNPTTDTIPLWAIVYANVTGAPDAVGRWTQAAVPAGGSISFEIPVVISGPAAVSSIDIRGNVEYVPGGRFRELLTELGIPLPDTNFSGTVPLDTQPRTPLPTRPGQVRTAVVLDPGPIKAVDTLPPLPPKAQ